MRSLFITLILIPLLLVGAGCKRRRNSSGQTQLLASTLYAADPNVATHFVKGFYNVEDNAWRWTGKDFSVELSPPLHSDQKGAQLVLHLAVPDVVMKKFNSVQLSATIEGYKLDPETFAKAGQFTYTRDIPPNKLQSDVATIDFSLDHALPPAGADIRELGIIVSEVGLVVK